MARRSGSASPASRTLLSPWKSRLKSDYPNVNWKQKKTYGILPVELSDEEMKTADGLIQAICW